MAVGDGVVEQVQYSIAACCSRVVGFGDGGPVGEVVHMRVFADEGQVGIGQGVQAGCRVVKAEIAARACRVAWAIPAPATAARKRLRLPKCT